MITTELLKYVLRGALKGIEEYEAMLAKEHVDPSGALGRILDTKSNNTSDEKLDLDKLLGDKK